MVSAIAFAMGGAMAGLFPTDFKSVQNYPEKPGYGLEDTQIYVLYSMGYGGPI